MNTAESKIKGGPGLKLLRKIVNGPRVKCGNCRCERYSPCSCKLAKRAR